ncbi:MAG: hypothetical protein KF709_01965 [Gemmatimonadaceae bacterium]|nr:hypothetical protein [Gemmatimonadaceae bacterium]
MPYRHLLPALVVVAALAGVTAASNVTSNAAVSPAESPAPALVQASPDSLRGRPKSAGTSARALPGAILPHKRIIAFYGNPLSRRMGVLGEYPTDQMLAMLDAEVAAWEAADPDTPVQPALQIITVVARELPGPDSMYRGRMADTLVERVLKWAETRGAIVFLDFQVGYSSVGQELPRYERFFRLPHVHAAIDPEFSMKNGGIPGKRMGTMDASDVNVAIRYLADLAKRHDLPPKVLIVHRFTRRGVTNAGDIRLDPHVQVVMHMDGFGSPTLKMNTWRNHIVPEPVQFVGWKQFYKERNDNPRTTIEQILALRPKVLYVQYQ